MSEETKSKSCRSSMNRSILQSTFWLLTCQEMGQGRLADIAIRVAYFTNTVPRLQTTCHSGLRTVFNDWPLNFSGKSVSFFILNNFLTEASMRMISIQQFLSSYCSILLQPKVFLKLSSLSSYGVVS